MVKRVLKSVGTASAAAMVVLVLAACGGKSDLQRAEDDVALTAPKVAVWAFLRDGDVDGAVARTRAWVAEADNQNVGRQEYLDFAADLSEAGCDRCAQVVSEAAP